MRLVHHVIWLGLFSVVACVGADPDVGRTESTDEPIGETADELAKRRLCGGPFKLDCGPKQYCRALRSDACPGPRQIGVCARKPEVCLDIYDPVCGCDGKTHGNACYAASAGVAVLHSGECEPLGPFCGGIASFPCPGVGQCVDDPRDDCDPLNGGADCSGVCTCNVLAKCGPGQHWDPSPEVCGCVPDITDPCATVRCAAGTHCVANPDGTATCAPGEQCGNAVCGTGLTCCNASCGICTPPGMACIQIACE